MLGGLYLLMAAMLVMGALMSRREPAAKMLTMALAWVAIFAGGFILFTFRDNLGWVAQRLKAEAVGTPVTQGKETRIPMAIDGHFWVSAKLNGHDVKFLIDSGATTTTLDRTTAAAAGVEMSDRRDQYVRTGNGVIRVSSGRADELTVGTISRRNMDGLADELGDLQLQVVFHAQMAEEAGLFTLEDVIERICGKMERRHPHIFGDADHGGHHLWEIIKAEERAADPDKSALAGVALALPALERAAKLQRRAASVAFDWPDVSGPRAKIDEELAELDAETDHDRKLEELGDLLFAVVNLARHLNVEPETALREANRKFEQRFRAIEQEPGFADLSLEKKEALWAAVKKAQADCSA